MEAADVCELQDKLRRKYSRLLEQRRTGAVVPTSAEEDLKSIASAAAAEICQSCHGQGRLHVAYGFRVLEEFCEACKGEGVVKSPKCTGRL
mmetsp:Transcript_6290/g.10849  ORF Transcript_6290/g.10849 Transcript_6290/m.10849 type:complete len:91 (+) Transcript_6290:58-330(+)